jgi:hypothetical protein
VSIGQLPPSPPAASTSCQAGADYLQPSVTGGELYAAREAGTISSWSTNASTTGAVSLKVFRRTADPDVFQVIAHSQAQTPVAGRVNTFPTALPVESGDLIGLHQGGVTLGSCTFPVVGDTVLKGPGNLGDGATGTFAPENDVRLNLSATLDPSNTFTFSGLTRNRRLGSAALTVTLSNPGVAVLSGKGIKKKHVTRALAVKGPITFGLAPAGKVARRLNRTGKAVVVPVVTFTPPGGDPHSESITIRLKKRRHPATL